MNRTCNRLIVACLAAVLSIVSSACSLLEKNTAPEPATPSVSPVVEVSEDYYAGVLPYKPNQTRGMLSRLSSYRIDFAHLELGLLEIAKETFPTDEYLFQEGQQISREQVSAWLSPQEKHPEGLNPNNGADLLIHVLEHNYLDKEKQSLAGIVIGLTLSPNYKDASGQDHVYTTDDLRAKGQQLAARIVQKVREQNREVPMVVALYQAPDKYSTLVPGRFIMTGTVNASEHSVSKWQQIDEEYYLFPSDAVYKAYPQISLQYDKLMKQSQNFFGEYIGLTGVGRFMGGELIELTLTATAEYDSRTEVLQFTEYVASLLNQLFDKQVHINLYVQTINRPLAVYVRPVDKEPYLHIYRN